MDKKTGIVIAAVAVAVVAAPLIALHGRSVHASFSTPSVETAVVSSNTTSADVVAEGATVSHAIANVNVQEGMKGTVSSVLADVGQHVTAGQVLCVIDAVDTQNKLISANADLAAARENYQLVLNPHRPEEVEQARLRVASSGESVKQAQTHLQLLLNGARPLEITQAQDAVDQAQQKLTTVTAQNQRNEALFSQELLPKADLEISQAALADAKSSLDSRQSALALLKEGARSEEIESAREGLAGAQLEHQNSEQAYKLILAGSRPEEIASAADHLQGAQAYLQETQLVYSRREVRAPIAGTITARNINPGEIASPGSSARTQSASPSPLSSTALFVITGDNNMEFMASVDQMFFKSLHIGQQVSVGIESLPGRSFPATIDRIAPVISYNPTKVSSAPLTFTVWAKLPNVSSILEPGQIGVMRAIHNNSGLVIPEAALVPFSSGDGIVYVVDNGTVHSQAVKYTSILDGQVNLTSGLKKGQTVIMSPTGLTDGEEVRVNNSYSPGSSGSTTPLLQ